MIIHIALGIKYKTWAFLFAIFWGCASELIGYGGRVMLWESPFSFPGFLIQISKCAASPLRHCPFLCCVRLSNIHAATVRMIVDAG